MSSYNHVSYRSVSADSDARLNRRIGTQAAPRKTAFRDASLQVAFRELSFNEGDVAQTASSFGRLQNILPISLAPSSVCNTHRPPKTPSKIPLTTERVATPTTVRKLHVSEARLSPKKGMARATSPCKTRFLSKDSNLTETAWEDNGVGERIARFEAGVEMMKVQMEGTTYERNSMKELIEMMKTRSKFF
jgi:hypothetical protein